MTKDDVIQMAREAGALKIGFNKTIMQNEYSIFENGIEAFANLIASKERQRLHKKFMQIHQSQEHSNNYWHFAARKISEES